MYTQDDYVSITGQIKKRAFALGILTAALCGLFIFGFVMHLNRVESWQWISYVSLLLAAALCLFCDGMLIAPLRAYRRHLKDVLFGRTREMTGRFKAIDSTPCLREGVMFYPVLLSQGDLENEEDDRLFYFDVQKPFPDFAAGDEVAVASHDRRIAHIRRA